MKAIRLTCLVLLFAATACVAQMYTVTDLGTIPGDSSLSGGDNSESRGINASGQVVGASMVSFHLFHAWRTAPNRPINPATDDLGTQVPGSGYSDATAISASGQVTGTYAIGVFRSYRTAPNSPINPTTDDLGTLGASSYNHAYGINASGQVVGTEYIYDVDDGGYHAFRTAPNSRINPATDDLGTLAPGGHNFKGSGDTYASGINDFGKVVGTSDIGMDVPFGGTFHAFRTAPNSPCA